MTDISNGHVGAMKSIFVHMSRSKRKLLAMVSSMQSKLRIKEKKHKRKLTRTTRNNRKPGS
jgi:hypothetical protein